MTCKTLLTTMVLNLIAVAGVVAQKVDSTNKYSWGENVGWMNWHDAEGGTSGVFADTEFLSGYIWCENVGWMNVGDGAGPYANTDGTNYGVNILDGDDLEGFAWGENVGWINFDTSGHAPDQARFDCVAGRFRGYAWGENIGWINLDDSVHFVEIVPADPLPDSVNPDKTRFISLEVDTVQEVGLRMRLTSLHHVMPPYTGGPSVPFTDFEFGAGCMEAGGCIRWVGPPIEYVESSASGIPFYASQLQCSPHYQDWSTVGLLHITGSAITPSSLYEVNSVAASCDGIESTCTAVSASVLEIATTRWGDVRTPYNPPDPSVQPDISDVSALVDKFRSVAGAPIKARGLLAGEAGNAFGEITDAVLDVDFSFSHISACVDAFRGVPYPYTVAACP